MVRASPKQADPCRVSLGASDGAVWLATGQDIHADPSTHTVLLFLNIGEHFDYPELI